jgi:hypothetical protein
MATKTTNASELTRLINQLRQERQQHEQAIAEIDATFKAFGIGLGAARGAAGKKGKGKGKGKGRGAAAAAPNQARGKGRGRRGAGRKGGRRTPWSRKFPITGDELILNFIREKSGASTEEIRKHWEAAGRRGKAENNLTLLFKSGKLKRSKLEGGKGRGSFYSLA